MKRITDIRERKKMEASGLEVHQAMMGLFEDRYNYAGFGEGFESSESLTVHSSEEESSNDEKQRFFDDIRRMKTHVSFDSSANRFHFEALSNEEKQAMNRSRTRQATKAKPQVVATQEPTQEELTEQQRERLKMIVNLFQNRGQAEIREDRASVASSVEPVE